MKIVAYDSPFIPPEWIAAHDLEPLKGRPAVPEERTPAGVCPYAWAFSRSIGDAEAAVFATTCDQMRRMSEIGERQTGIPVFLMNVPSAWNTAQACRLYSEELRRMGSFFLSIGGTEPSRAKIATTAKEYDSRRLSLNRTPSPGGKGPNLAITGSPLMECHTSVLDVIERAGGRVALDGTAGGERALPSRYDRRILEDDPLAAMCEAYFAAMPDAFKRPNNQLYEWLKKKIRSHSIEGVIFWSYTWCDLWRAEAFRMKEWLDIPLLFVEAADEVQITEHMVSRIESFVEMIS